MSKKPSSSPAPLAPIRPAWITKTSPKGRQYRVCTLPLDLLPRLLEAEALEPRAFFYYPPEGGEVLGVSKIGEKEVTEL